MSPREKNKLLHGTLDTLILRTLDEGPLHGYAVARWIEARAGEAIKVEEGSLYPALYRLEKKGLLASEWGLSELERNGQIAFRYCTPQGESPNGSDANPNGSVGDIAGVYNREKNVLGMMPHPERASEAILGNEDGLALFQSLRRHLGIQ